MKANQIDRIMDEEQIRLRNAIDLALLRVAHEEQYSLEEVWDEVELMLAGEFEAVH